MTRTHFILHSHDRLMRWAIAREAGRAAPAPAPAAGGSMAPTAVVPAPAAEAASDAAMRRLLRDAWRGEAGWAARWLSDRDHPRVLVTGPDVTVPALLCAAFGAHVDALETAGPRAESQLREFRERTGRTLEVRLVPAIEASGGRYDLVWAHDVSNPASTNGASPAHFAAGLKEGGALLIDGPDAARDAHAAGWKGADGSGAATRAVRDALRGHGLRILRFERATGASWAGRARWWIVAAPAPHDDDRATREERVRRQGAAGRRIGLRPRGVYGRLKRALDIVAASALLVIAAPLLFAIALAIRIDSHGPSLFRQRRIGQGSRHFTIFKFRTMTVGTPDLASHLMGPGSSRVTRLGRFLRRTSLDELPQLWNVLCGDMTLIGPRPALYNQYDLIAMRQRVGVDALKPGVTGWAQIHGRDDIPLDVKVGYDRHYLDHVSPRLDLAIALRTAVTLFSSRGVY